MIERKALLVGFGKLGLLHFSQFSSLNNIKVNKIIETDSNIRKILKKNFNDIEVYPDLDSSCLNDVDFGIITSPTFAHYENLKFFINNNINTFCEKPMTLNYEQAKELKALNEKKNTIMHIGYMYEHYPTFMKAEKIIKNKELGEIYWVNSNMYVSQYLKKNQSKSWRFNKKKSGGGVLITQSSHLLYLLIKYIGKIENIYGFSKKIFSDNEDYCHLTLTSKDGVIINLDSSWSANNFRTPFLEIKFECSNGTMEVNENIIKLYFNKNTENFKKGYQEILKTDLQSTSYFNVAGICYAIQAEYFLKKINEFIEDDNLDTSIEVQRVIDHFYQINEQTT